MDKPFVLVDVDGVILNWDVGVDHYIKVHGEPHQQPTCFDEHAYDLSDRYGYGLEEANQIVWDFHTHESFAEIPALPGVADAITKLGEDYALVAITACGDDPLIVKYREQNLHTLFPNMFKEIICTNTGLAKRTHLAKFPPSYWIEDHARNAHLGREFGHVCMLVDAPHNHHAQLDQVRRVKNFPEAVEIILSQTLSKVSC